jgi:hypothetical protein
VHTGKKIMSFITTEFKPSDETYSRDETPTILRLNSYGDPYHPQAFDNLTEQEQVVQEAAYVNTEKFGSGWIKSEQSAEWRASHRVVFETVSINVEKVDNPV